MDACQIIAGRFEIGDLEKDLLGRGGMGDVYRATDTQTGETVAVKALNPGVVARDPDILERFVREGQALRQLNHPNIVRMIAAVEEQGQHYLIVEYVSGGSLQDLLAAQGRLASTRVMQIALEVADALTRAHHLGIIHRDLKPANVLLAQDGTPRLTDFGLAHLPAGSRLTQSGILMGTVDYVSPEACQGKPPDERTDIWAFGVLLFEMLAGCLPFTGATFAAQLNAILTRPVPDLSQLAPGVPDGLADLVYRMLEKDPQQRVPSVRQVAAELEVILKGWKTPTPVRLAVATQVASSAQLLSFLDEEEAVERPVFVTREYELAKLDGFLNMALAGQGRVVFITGEAGQGKTALVQEFAWRAQAACPDLVVASGNCNAYTGIGDPYLPFREVLGLLTGDVEAQWAARAISREQGRRLWHTLPLAAQALVETGPDLLDVFVSGADLTKRAATFTPWPEQADCLPRLEHLVERKKTVPSAPDLKQSALFEQYTRVLWALARQRPLLLVLDDLQWADGGSISLLFHLGRRIAGCRLLIVGAYRPAEVALGRGEERHPLEPVINEFRRQFGDIEVDLRQAEGRQFVDALLDTEPNRLGEVFRKTLYQQTGGHPLATVELLRDMQERGGLVRDETGRWIEGAALDWGTLPARVEAMIAERMGRLDESGRAVLRVASVEGETFTAEVVARVLAADEREIVGCLSGELDRGHRLVSAQGVRRTDGQSLSVYRFRHILFQRYLYNSLDPVERAHQHQAVGTALQALYGEKAEEISVQLARHFQEAGTVGKAADYLDQAGDRARELYAHQEAVDHYQQAMSAYERALGDRWDPLQRAALERKIGEALFRKGENQQALDHLGRGLAYLGRPLPSFRWAVRLAIVGEIVRQIGHRFLPGLFLKPIGAPVSPTLEEESRLCEYIGWIEGFVNEERFLLVTLRVLNVAERGGYAYGIALSSMGLAVACDMVPLFWLAGDYHHRAVPLAEQMQHPNALGLAYLGLTMHKSCLGEWDAAIEHGHRAARIYQEISDRHSWGYVTFMMGVAMVYLGDFAAALTRALDIVRTGEEGADLEVQCWGLWIQGTAQRRMGQFEKAISTLRKAIELAQASQDYLICQAAHQELGRCYLLQGQLEQALTTQEQLRQYHLEHPAKSTVYLPLHNGLAEAYLVAAEQREFEKANWLKRAGPACQAALRHGKAYCAVMPDAMRLQGTLEWLRGKPAAAQRWWQRSLALAEKMGQRYDVGMTLLEMGKRLGESAHLERAEAILAEIGAEWDLARAREALRETP